MRIVGIVGAGIALLVAEELAYSVAVHRYALPGATGGFLQGPLSTAWRRSGDAHPVPAHVRRRSAPPAPASTRSPAQPSAPSSQATGSADPTFPFSPRRPAGPIPERAAAPARVAEPAGPLRDRSARPGLDAATGGPFPGRAAQPGQGAVPGGPFAAPVAGALGGTIVTATSGGPKVQAFPRRTPVR